MNIAQVGQARRELSRLKEVAAREWSGGRPLLEDARFRDRIAEVEIDLLALGITVMRVLSAETARRDPGPESSVLKIRGAEIQQTLSELKMQAIGHYALPWLPEALEPGWHAADGTEQDWPAYSVSISTCARLRSSAARTRSNATSSPGGSWVCERLPKVNRHGF